MPVTTEDAARIARAYGMTLTDAATLITMADTVEEAQHIAIQFAGTAAERSSEAHTLARKQRDAEQAAENQAFAAYQEAHPTPQKPPRIDAQPELRDGMSDNDRVRAINKAHEANVRAEAEDRADAAQQSSRDYFAWKQTLNPHGPPTRLP